MSLRRQVLDELEDAAASGLAAIVDAVERERLRREAQPKYWYEFHTRMARRLPKWRVLARAHHRRMARRYDAMVGAAAVTAWLQCTGGDVT